MSIREIVIISGLTAAGKTTHGKILAEELNIPYYSASGVLRQLAQKFHGVEDAWGDRWHPGIDEVRGAADIDREVDEAMLGLVQSQTSGIFDACFLPWTYGRDDVLRVWIESDVASRVRKCYVSHLDNSRVSLTEAAEVVRRKDDVTRSILLRSTGMSYVPDQRFDLIVSNTDLIPTPTVSSAVHGVAMFSKLMDRCVKYLLGIDGSRPRDARVLRIRTSGQEA